MPRTKKAARDSARERAKKKCRDLWRLSLSTEYPEEAATARKRVEQIGRKYGFTVGDVFPETTTIEERAAHEVRPMPARPIQRKARVKPTQEIEFLRSAYCFFTGENPTPRAFERSLEKVAGKLADFLETVRER
jgi:hypothetical protein